MPLLLRLAAIAFAGIILSLVLYGWAQKAGVTTAPSAGVATAPPGPAKLLFSSGFEDSTALSVPSDCYGTGCWQHIVSMDSSTGFSWPPKIWGGGLTRFQLIADATVDATTVGDYMFNEIQTVTGHNGTPTRALYQQMSRSGCCGTLPQGGHPAQDAFTLQPVGETSDLYISYWLKYQPNLTQSLIPPNWRVLFEWKTGILGDDGDYRVLVELVTWGPDGPLSWYVVGDNVANSSNPNRQIYWEKYTTTTAKTLADWIKFEVFWHRSAGSDGRVWMAVNGKGIVDHYGPNMGEFNAPINRIMMPNLYSGGSYPIYQWVDDLQIWDGFPPDAAPH